MSIVSDRDGRFTSQFWQAFQKALGTKVNMSTTDLPRPTISRNGLYKHQRTYVIYWKNSWEKYLLLVEFAYNNGFRASIGMSPYEALYGQQCCTPCIGPYWEKEITSGRLYYNKLRSRFSILEVKLWKPMIGRKVM